MGQDRETSRCCSLKVLIDEYVEMFLNPGGGRFFLFKLHVIFKNRAGVLYRDLKLEAIAEYFRPDKARTASFFKCFMKFTT